MVTTRSAIYSPITLHGRRIVLRTMTEQDYDAWYEVRTRCRDWLLKWEPRSAHAVAPGRRPPQLREPLRDS